jgi:hypothetical protein
MQVLPEQLCGPVFLLHGFFDIGTDRSGGRHGGDEVDQRKRRGRFGGNDVDIRAAFRDCVCGVRFSVSSSMSQEHVEVMSLWANAGSKPESALNGRQAHSESQMAGSCLLQGSRVRDELQ